MIGRALRDKMRDDADEALNGAARAVERVRDRMAGAQAVRERVARYPTLTAENVGEAIDWQSARIIELKADPAWNPTEPIAKNGRTIGWVTRLDGGKRREYVATFLNGNTTEFTLPSRKQAIELLEQAAGR